MEFYLKANIHKQVLWWFSRMLSLYPQLLGFTSTHLCLWPLAWRSCWPQISLLWGKNFHKYSTLLKKSAIYTWIAWTAGDYKHDCFVTEIKNNRTQETNSSCLLCLLSPFVFFWPGGRTDMLIFPSNPCWNAGLVSSRPKLERLGGRVMKLASILFKLCWVGWCWEAGVYTVIIIAVTLFRSWWWVRTYFIRCLPAAIVKHRAILRVWNYLANPWNMW